MRTYSNRELIFRCCGAKFTHLLLAATKLGQGNIFTSVCQEFCPQGGGRVSASVHAGVHHPNPPQGADPPDPPGSRHPPGPGTPPEQTPPEPGTPRTRQPLPPGADTPSSGSRHPPGPCTPPRTADCSIRSTSGRYASYWNAFLSSNDIHQYSPVLSLFVMKLEQGCHTSIKTKF